jgi:hypothetical protein
LVGPPGNQRVATVQAGGKVDLNGDGLFTVLSNYDLNGSGTIESLIGADDWSQLKYDFRQNIRAANGAIAPLDSDLTFDEVHQTNLQLLAGNAPPVATADNGTTIRDAAVSIGVLSNDGDVGGALDPASVTITVAPAHGTASVNPVTGAVLYTPASSYVGADSFMYRVKDNLGANSNAVRVNVTVAPSSLSSVVGRRIFYNQSVWDSNSAAINAVADNAAIAPGKVPYLPGGGTAVAANITNYSRGINGIMVDLAAGVTHTAITAADFVFKVGNNNAPSTWVAAPAPSAISVIPGGGVGGSDRVEITWASGAIKNKWLEVQVLATANTGLGITDVHFWGNKIADSASTSPATSFETTSTDSAQVLGNIGSGKPITDLRDYNRDGQVTSTDSAIVLANIGNIVRLNVAVGGPFAPETAPLSAIADLAGALGRDLEMERNSESLVAFALTSLEHARAFVKGSTASLGSNGTGFQSGRPIRLPTHLNVRNLDHVRDTAIVQLQSQNFNQEDEPSDSLPSETLRGLWGSLSLPDLI